VTKEWKAGDRAMVEIARMNDRNVGHRQETPITPPPFWG
jgi:hypothetical protein